MRSAKLDRIITIERLTETVAASGAVSASYSPLATVRAELVQQLALEAQSPLAEATSATVIFRIRYLPGITMADRINYSGMTYALKAVTEIGRRREIELKVVSA